MVPGRAEDAGGLTPAKDDNTALCHFGHRTLPIFKCVDYISGKRQKGSGSFTASAPLSALQDLG